MAPPPSPVRPATPRKSTERCAFAAPGSWPWATGQRCGSPRPAPTISRRSCRRSCVSLYHQSNQGPIGDIAVEISADRVVTIHYTLKDDSGAVLDSSAGGEPLAYIQGHGNLVSGLEKALEGKQDGASLDLSLAPADGYGVRDEALVQRVPKRTLQGSGEIKKGMQFQARTQDGMRLFTVTAVVGDMITLDGNHPLADQNLHFNVEVVGVREATGEELEHGHVHGAGGHHH